MIIDMKGVALITPVGRVADGVWLSAVTAVSTSITRKAGEFATSHGNDMAFGGVSPATKEFTLEGTIADMVATQVADYFGGHDRSMEKSLGALRKMMEVRTPVRLTLPTESVGNAVITSLSITPNGLNSVHVSITARELRTIGASSRAGSLVVKEPPKNGKAAKSKASSSLPSKINESALNDSIRKSVEQAKKQPPASILFKAKENLSKGIENVANIFK